MSINLASMVPSSRSNPTPGAEAKEHVKSLFEGVEPPMNSRRFLDFVPYLVNARDVATAHYHAKAMEDACYVFEYEDIAGYGGI